MNDTRPTVRRLRAENAALTSERDEARAALARVDALFDKWDAEERRDWIPVWKIRAAIEATS